MARNTFSFLARVFFVSSLSCFFFPNTSCARSPSVICPHGFPGGAAFPSRHFPPSAFQKEHQNCAPWLCSAFPSSSAGRGGIWDNQTGKTQPEKDAVVWSTVARRAGWKRTEGPAFCQVFTGSSVAICFLPSAHLFAEAGLGFTLNGWGGGVPVNCFCLKWFLR